VPLGVEEALEFCEVVSRFNGLEPVTRDNFDFLPIVFRGLSWLWR
jgi:hypothetical protein